MKKIYILFFVAFAASFTSCDYLDFDESVGQSKDYTFRYFSEAKKAVTDIYGRLQDDFGAVGGALRETATDNAMYLNSGSGVYTFFDGSWSDINTVDNQWGTMYANIRATNNFLASFDLENFKAFENNNDYDEYMKIAIYHPYEVRFLRALFYFELVKRYGDVPLVTTVLNKEEANKITRTPYEDVIDFICKECDSAAKYLPADYSKVVGVAETGRATRGAAMALKSRTLLYAASPLFNKNANVDDKYKKAAKAALDLINESQYTLTMNEAMWGVGNNLLNSTQLILEVRNGNSNSFEYANVALGLEGGKGNTCPSQNLIDAFEMSNGDEFDWTKAEHTKDIYAKRDPRLDKTVIRNGSLWQGIAIQTYIGGANGQPVAGAQTTSATKTGYYLRKYLDETVSLKPGNITSTPHHWVMFRYAEVLLNYAEAMNEWKGPDYTDGTFKYSAKWALNKVREYVPMPLVTTNDKDEFQKRIRNERRVELAFEDHRFWDVRRWKEGETFKNIYGIQIERQSSSYTFTRIKSQSRIWEDKMYFYPIPRGEIYATGGTLVQNKDW